MAEGDLEEHALNSSHDFYALLEVTPAASESEIRRAYRKTALKYHPDKVGANEQALEKFHLLQIAYDVLLDGTIRQLYDNARRAREEKKQREAAYSDRRRQLKEDLERRESAGLKRKRGEDAEEEAFQEKLRRLAADGARRRKEREEQLRKEAQEQWESEQKELYGGPVGHMVDPEPVGEQVVEDADRTIKLRYPADAPKLDENELRTRFSRFGKIEDINSKTKKIKIEGEKHRKEYIIAIIVFESIVGAHAAMTDIHDLVQAERADDVESPKWTMFENVDWLSGKEPDCVPKPMARSATKAAATNLSTPTSDEVLLMRLKTAEKMRLAEKRRKEEAAAEAREAKTMPETPSKPPMTPATERIKNAELGHGLKKVPSFGSFKGTPKAATSNINTPTSDEDTMRLKARDEERKRLAEELRKAEEEEDARAALQENA